MPTPTWSPHHHPLPGTPATRANARYRCAPHPPSPPTFTYLYPARHRLLGRRSSQPVLGWTTTLPPAGGASVLLPLNWFCGDRAAQRGITPPRTGPWLHEHNVLPALPPALLPAAGRPPRTYPTFMAYVVSWNIPAPLRDASIHSAGVPLNL